MTDSADRANVVLPATAFGEERVSFTSTERRIQIAERVIDPRGTDARLGTTDPAGPRDGRPWSYESAADVMREIGEVIPFYSGAGYDNLARDYGRNGHARRITRSAPRACLPARKRAGVFNLFPSPATDPAGNPDAFPFTLVFGHSLYYWHQNVLIRHSETLKREYRLLLLDIRRIRRDQHRRRQAPGIRDGGRIVSALSAVALFHARVTDEFARHGFCSLLCAATKREMLAGGDGRSLVRCAWKRRPIESAHCCSGGCFKIVTCSARAAARSSRHSAGAGATVALTRDGRESRAGRIHLPIRTTRPSDSSFRTSNA